MFQITFKIYSALAHNLPSEKVTGQLAYMPTCRLSTCGDSSRWLVYSWMLPLPVLVCFCRYFETSRANEYKNTNK